MMLGSDARVSAQVAKQRKERLESLEHIVFNEAGFLGVALCR